MMTCEEVLNQQIESVKAATRLADGVQDHLRCADAWAAIGFAIRETERGVDHLPPTPQ